MIEIVAIPKRCPHEDIRNCPLYVAGHRVGLPTCMTGDWLMGCAVDRGEICYAEAAATLMWNERKWWAWFEHQVEKREAKEQRERNTSCLRAQEKD